jgi:hypothetical protein
LATPVKDIVTVGLPQAGPAWLRIAAADGRLVLQQQLTNMQELIDVSRQLPAGSYLLSIEQNGRFTSDVLIKR